MLVPLRALVLWGWSQCIPNGGALAVEITPSAGPWSLLLLQFQPRIYQMDLLCRSIFSCLFGGPLSRSTVSTFALHKALSYLFLYGARDVVRMFLLRSEN